MNESKEAVTVGSSLLKAVCLSRLRLARLLLEGGAYINESNEHGETPLMVACKTHHTDSQSVPQHKMVRYLLENGADPNIQDKAGKTALMHACLEQAGAEILSLLLSNGADPTLEDHSGSSALVHAVNSGNRDVLRVLLDACKMKGKEVIIITTDKLLSGHQVTKQYLNVPPPTDREEHMQYNPASCCMSADMVKLQRSPQCSSASVPLQPDSPPLGRRDSEGLSLSEPGFPSQHHSSLYIPSMDKQNNLHRLHSAQWTKSPSSLLQQRQTSSPAADSVEVPPEEERSFRVSSFGIHRRHPAVSRHHSIDVKDTTGLLKAMENLSGTETREGRGRRGFGRKMSYDSAAASLHSASHPDLHQDYLPFPRESCPADEDSSYCLRQVNVSSLQNVVHRRNIGINHYSSDSQLPQFGCCDISSKCTAGAEPERQKVVNNRSSTPSGSRESLEGSVQRRDTVRLEQRISATHLLNHIAHTRPGYLPPLNPHAPIPDIGITSSSTYPLSGSSRTLNAVLTGSKAVLPCAPVLPVNLIKANKMLWRRHSMQSEQIKQLHNFEETFSH